jgi:hypothetical protein
VAHNMRAAACSCMVQKQPRHARSSSTHAPPRARMGHTMTIWQFAFLPAHACQSQSLVAWLSPSKAGQSIVQYSTCSKDAPTR